MEQFLNEFGDITLTKLASLILAFGFLYKIYFKIKDYFSLKALEEQKRVEKIDNLIKEAEKYPEYQKQNKKAQEHLQGQIDELNAMHQQTYACIIELKGVIDKRDRNFLRDKVIEKYKYYTNKKINPDLVWNQSEAENFWELFSDYEDTKDTKKSDEFIHKIVQPTMAELKIIDT